MKSKEYEKGFEGGKEWLDNNRRKSFNKFMGWACIVGSPIFLFSKYALTTKLFISITLLIVGLLSLYMSKYEKAIKTRSHRENFKKG